MFYEREKDVEDTNEEQNKKRRDYAVRNAQCIDRFINLCSGQESDESRQDEIQEMIDEGERAALRILIDIKDFTVEMKISYLTFLLKYCHSANYKYFFLINYKYAKLLFKSVVRRDTTTLVQANEASLLL